MICDISDDPWRDMSRGETR